ncbi:MAG: Dabb family protein, partial [Flammeovirgaceae bacterium]
MIHHNVLFKFKPETSQEAIDTIVKELEALVPIIPEIHSLRVGTNFSARGKGFELMLVSTFKTQEDLVVYGKHPKHLGVISTYIKPHLAD